MRQLTERRLQAATPILDDYLERLMRQKSFDVRGFESELKTCWDVSYRGIKPLIRGLAKVDRYMPVAAYYMEHSNTPGVVMEFQRPLATLYGCRHFRAKDREQKRSQFWESVFGPTTQP